MVVARHDASCATTVELGQGGNVVRSIQRSTCSHSTYRPLVRIMSVLQSALVSMVAEVQTSSSHPKLNPCG